MPICKESNVCPICGGTLMASPIVLTSSPKQYQAICKKCGKIFTSYHPIGVSSSDTAPKGMWSIN